MKIKAIFTNFNFKSRMYADQQTNMYILRRQKSRQTHKHTYTHTVYLTFAKHLSTCKMLRTTSLGGNPELIRPACDFKSMHTKPNQSISPQKSDSEAILTQHSPVQTENVPQT